MKIKIILTLSLLSLGALQAPGVVIFDAFSYTGSTTGSDTFDDSSIIGGEVDVNRFEGVSSNLISYNANFNGSTFSLSNPDMASSGGGMGLVYDGDDNNTIVNANGLSPLDLSMTNALAIDVVSITGSMQLRLGMRSPSSNATFVEVTIDTAGTYSFDYSLFNNFSNFEITDVGSLNISINDVDTGESIELDNFRAVPEPSTSLLLGLSLTIPLIRRKR